MLRHAYVRTYGCTFPIIGYVVRVLLLGLCIAREFHYQKLTILSVSDRRFEVHVLIKEGIYSCRTCIYSYRESCLLCMQILVKSFLYVQLQKNSFHNGDKEKTNCLCVLTVIH